MKTRLTLDVLDNSESLALMKVIFLDVDGVLNDWNTNTRNPENFIGVDQHLCEKLRTIVAATGAKIVLSSAWRLSPRCLSYLWQECGPTVDCIGATPYLLGEERGEEIKDWLAVHPEVDSFVILDDRTDMSDLGANLVHTNDMVGLTDENVELAIKILNG
jgi:hypothetical protein